MAAGSFGVCEVLIFGYCDQEPSECRIFIFSSFFLSFLFFSFFSLLSLYYVIISVNFKRVNTSEQALAYGRSFVFCVVLFLE